MDEAPWRLAGRFISFLIGRWVNTMDISENSGHSKFSLALAVAAGVALLALPVLLFNKPVLYPATFLFKWALVFPVAAYGAGIAAFMMLCGDERVRVSFIEVSWFALSVALAIQPLVIPLRSFPEWVRGWYFFAALGGACFTLRCLPMNAALPAVSRAITLTGALSTAIGFIRRADPSGDIPFAFNMDLGHNRFVANTAYDGILGIYLALAIVSGAWLLLRAARLKKYSRPGWAGRAGVMTIILDLALMMVNAAGLRMAASRSAFLSLAVGVVVLLLAMRPNKKTVAAFAAAAVLAALAVLASARLAPDASRIERRDMSQFFSASALTPEKEGRFAIWGVTLDMIRSSPLLGVGLGNYKWNYMDAMSRYYATRPDERQRYTYWAHDEYLQWTAETGVIFAALFFALVIAAIKIGASSKNARGGDSALAASNENDGGPLAWSCAVLAAILVDCCFSRPMHHADTAFFLPAALAMISRLRARDVRLPAWPKRAAAVVVIAAAASGLALFAQMLSAQGAVGLYYSKGLIMMAPAEEREARRVPFLLSDVLLEMTAREEYERTKWQFSQGEKTSRDAIRLLESVFKTEPRYEELNKLMLLFQERRETDMAKPYLKYYPPEERKKILGGVFDGKYMMD
jgi:O-antigen ligase